ncbi:phosphopantetheine-binding protein [Reichenbachiella ulvae]|uniref:Phosphopantetheine-binding protein n=1 Tax=Reichenbachiella ulvae TaxID=2980104 RepID=A0ABT3D1W7_9BACT|nr:phosphopantetheine-binding protein [Reichenbachiella ulvae]MCV9389443.1 phosphopantetheine-binding protein [Reichenbachiella ulvae]
MDKEALKVELKEKIIKYLNLMDMKPEDIKDDEPLFGPELGLDSIDSIELVVLLEREYGIKINNPTEGRKILVDVNVMADYILENSPKI